MIIPEQPSRGRRSRDVQPQVVVTPRTESYSPPYGSQGYDQQPAVIIPGPPPGRRRSRRDTQPQVVVMPGNQSYYQSQNYNGYNEPQAVTIVQDRSDEESLSRLQKIWHGFTK